MAKRGARVFVYFHEPGVFKASLFVAERLSTGPGTEFQGR
jgi:hypothetical protein